MGTFLEAHTDLIASYSKERKSGIKSLFDFRRISEKKVKSAINEITSRANVEKIILVY